MSSKDAHELLSDPGKFYVELKKDGNATFQLEKVKFYQKLITVMKSGSLENCIEYAIHKFTETSTTRLNSYCITSLPNILILMGQNSGLDPREFPHLLFTI